MVRRGKLSQDVSQDRVDADDLPSIDAAPPRKQFGERSGKAEIRKQVSLYISLEDWRALRKHLVKTEGASIQSLLTDWTAPHLAALPRAEA